jgi:hypothetical protein
LTAQTVYLFSQELGSQSHETSSAALLSTATSLVLEIHLESNFTSLLDDALLASSIGYLARCGLVVE